MTRRDPAEVERARHLVTLYILTARGDVSESHRMQASEVERSAGEIIGRWRDAHGREPGGVRVRFPDGRDGAFLLPRSWRGLGVPS
jgi:hypothetical protein